MSDLRKTYPLDVEPPMSWTHVVREVPTVTVEQREEALETLTQCLPDGAFLVATTGKTGRELYEIRERTNAPQRDFLTVGGMGHASSIALGVALRQPERWTVCLDGDGAVLMHMGSMAVIGANKPSNLIHIVINNGAHETVGGMPTVAGQADLPAIAKACGYPNAVSVSSFGELDAELKAARERKALSFIEVKCSIGAREDLGRPTTSAIENKESFMEYLKTL